VSSSLTEDNRPIDLIYLPQAPEEEFYCVGHDGVTRIEVYDDNGQMARVPWLAVFKGEEVAMRSPAHHWIIGYALNGGGDDHAST